MKGCNLSFLFRPPPKLSSPRPDPEQTPHLDNINNNISNNKNDENHKTNTNDNDITETTSGDIKKNLPSQADHKRHNSSRRFLAYDGYTELQLSRLFLFPGRGKRVTTIREPRGPDLDSRGFKVSRNIDVGTLPGVNMNIHQS